MSKTKQIFILTIIIAVAAIAGRTTANNPIAVSPVHADQGASSGAQKWEYCAITAAYYVGGNFGDRGNAVVRYFQVGGAKDEFVELVPDIGKKNVDYGREVLAKAIAKLGNEGWEMVTKEADWDTNFRPFYFKRPKQ
jgi:hypothetical protein